MQFLNAMNLLWGFNLGKPLDTKGKEIEPDTWDYAVVRSSNILYSGLLIILFIHQGISFSPNPFKCRFTPRSPQHAETIRRELRSFGDAFIPFEQDLVPEDRKYVDELRQSI